MKKRLLIAALILICGMFVLAASVVIFLLTADLRPDAEKYASRALNRKVTIGDLKVHWGSTLRVEADDFHLASPEWGSELEMMRFAHMSAVIDTPPLFKGKVRFQKLTFDKPEIFLERDQNGVGNWHFRDLGRENAHKAGNRDDFPIMLDAKIHGGLFRMKTSGGNILRLDVGDMAIGADSEDSPVSMIIDGAFNGVKAKLEMKGDTFSEFRKKSYPYRLGLKITTQHDTLLFDGTMTDPLNADGVKGILDFDASMVGDMMPIFGLNMKANLPIQIKGDMTRNGDHWLLENAQGKISANAFSGTLKLDEGSRREPDAVGIDVDFSRLNLHPIIDGVSPIGPTKASDLDRLSLRMPGDPGILVDAHIQSGEAYYEPAHITDVDMKLRTKPGKIDLESLSFVMAGGHDSIHALLDATEKVPHFHAEMEMKNGDASRLINMAGDYSGAIDGRVNARAVLDMTGDTVISGLKASSGGVVAYMNKGTVTRSFLEKASMDLRALIRRKEGRADIGCLIGVYDMHNGNGTVWPLKLQTAKTTLTGGGNISLLTKQVDITMRSSPDTSGHYALDVPLRFSGSFYNIGILPGGDTTFTNAAQNRLPRGLSPFLQDMADRSRCITE